MNSIELGIIREDGRILDLREGRRGMALLLKAPLYTKREAPERDPLDAFAARLRPLFMRAVEAPLGHMQVVTEQEVLLASARTLTIEDDTYINVDYIAMAVDPGALSVPTKDIRVIRYDDFNAQYVTSDLSDIAK